MFLVVMIYHFSITIKQLKHLNQNSQVRILLSSIPFGLSLWPILLCWNNQTKIKSVYLSKLKLFKDLSFYTPTNCIWMAHRLLNSVHPNQIHYFFSELSFPSITYAIHLETQIRDLICGSFSSFRLYGHDRGQNFSIFL